VLGLTSIGSRWTARGLLLLGLAILSGCTSAAQADDRLPVESEHGYFLVPRDLIPDESGGDDLFRCYESQIGGDPLDITSVQLELFWDGQGFRPPISQSRANLAEEVASCTERLTIDWQLDPEYTDTSTIYPLELGPRE